MYIVRNHMFNGWFHLGSSGINADDTSAEKMHSKVIFLLILIFATCYGKKGLAKLKLHAEEQNLVKYENVALFSYGSQEQNR